jgi:beta-lactam-binding protein with PASTA domain/tRNA A-37 threonylcarbamoyl transferase component Bud32
MTLAGRVFSSRYEIQREVAQGGMAEVYLARDQLLNRPVALKALFPEYAREPSFVERFRREAQAAANLNHPNIVAIYDWGQESGTYFIVMEYVEGRSLRDLVRSESPLDPNQAAEITAEIASALAFAHRNGVVHRDVKPGNVLLTRSGNVKVTDFGIARAGASDGLTQTGSVMGTATYFSPEQAQGLPVDGRSDVYSLGVVLYEMVTGGAPFTGDSPVAVAYKHVREDPVGPSQRNADVPRDLEQIIMTALSKDVDQRYQTADDLRADLLRFRRGRPLASAPVTAMVAEVPTSATATQGSGAYAAAAAATVASPTVDERGRYIGAPTYQRHRRNPALVTFLVLVGLAAVIGLILLLAIKLGGSEGKVGVPNVLGKKVNVARQMLTDAHLTSTVERVNDAAPIDTVIVQDPPADKNVARNSTVKLTVSSGAEQVLIPFEIKNMPVKDATDLLNSKGFEVKLKPQSDNTIAKDRVIDSRPAAGTNAPKGGSVTLLVSTGTAPKAVPDVKNLSQDQAAQALIQAGFDPSKITFVQEVSDTVQEGSATRTDPPADQSVPTDTPIRVFISSGKAKVEVPPEIGRTVDEATFELKASGFTVSTLNKVDDNNVGKVIEMSPAAGTKVQPGTNILLTIGVKSPTSSTTTTTGP